MKSKFKNVPECSICHADCCRHLILPIDDSNIKNINDYRKWIACHGLEIFVFKGKLAVIIEKDCNKLEGDKCTLYESEGRPIMCGEDDCPKKDRFLWNTIKPKLKKNH